MRLAKAWTIAAKDFKIFAKKRTILYSIVGFEVFVSVVMPLILEFIIVRFVRTGPTASVYPTIDAFSWFFVASSAYVPVSIAAYSLVGERVQNSLEPLLAAPVTDEEILVGKAIGAFLPAIIATYVGAVVFMALIDAFTFPRVRHLYYPNWTMGVILLVLAPLASLFSVGFNVIVSSRTSDVRTAQQVGSVPMGLLSAVYVLSLLQVLTLSPGNLLLLGAGLLIVDLLTYVLVRRTFHREEILTRWK